MGEWIEISIPPLYLMTIINTLILSIIAGLIITWIFEYILKTNKKLRNKYYTQENVIFGYHVHHSNYGLALFTASLITYYLDYPSAPLILFGMGIGIILMHTISEKKFVFVDKQRGSAESALLK